MLTNSKLLLFSMLIASTSSIAYNPPQSVFHHYNYSDEFWRDFDNQLHRLNNRVFQIRSLTESLTPPSRRFFDQKSRKYVLQMVINGVTKDKINIYTKNNLIGISATSKTAGKSPNSESSSESSFSQYFSLPTDADQDAISAIFNNGILTIEFPKTNSPQMKVMRIKVK